MSLNRVTPQDPDPALKTGKDNIIVRSGHLNPLIDAFNEISPAENTLSADIITESTAGAGVTVDGVLIKDSSVALADGTVSNLAVKLGADKNNGLYGVSDTQLGVAVEGVLVAMFDTNGLATSEINEQVVGVGVTVDSVLLKDGGVSNAGETILAGFYPIGAQQALSGPGAVNLTSYFTDFTSTGTGDALTLANGSQKGQLKQITYIAEAAGGDTGVLTLTGYTSITFNAVWDEVLLIWTGAAWIAIGVYGVTIV